MRLLVDPTCGRLVTYLRFCGHDAASALDCGVEGDDGLLALARDEDRLLVTRSASLADRADGVHVARGDLDERLRSLRAAGVDLTPADRPTRCGRCNGPLAPLGPDDPVPAYAPGGGVDRYRCRDCGQVFWRGGHWERIERRLSGL